MAMATMRSAQRKNMNNVLCVNDSMNDSFPFPCCLFFNSSSSSSVYPKRDRSP